MRGARKWLHATNFLDVGETTFTYDNGRGTYAPKNVNGQFADHDMTMAQAIAISDNIYAVKP